MSIVFWVLLLVFLPLIPTVVCSLFDKGVDGVYVYGVFFVIGMLTIPFLAAWATDKQYESQLRDQYHYVRPAVDVLSSSSFEAYDDTGHKCSGNIQTDDGKITGLTWVYCVNVTGPVPR